VDSANNTGKQHTLELNKYITETELREAIGKISSYRAAGQDELKGEYFQYLGDAEG
jgi:hypothetical protein